MIYIETVNPRDLDISQSEILRYAGMGKGAPEQALLDRLGKVKKEMISSLTPRACYTFCQLSISGNLLDFGTFQVTSDSLAKSLAGCEWVLFFGATVGAGADRVMAKYSLIEPASAVLSQAVATAAVESICDKVLQSVKERLMRQGEKKTLSAKRETTPRFDRAMSLRPRFSPGYGDFSITHQKDLCTCLNTPKTIGVSLTDALMMTPAKSVTAVAGIGDAGEDCTVSGCEVCEKQKDCLYARG